MHADATSSMGRGFDVLSALTEITSVAPFRATVSDVAAHLGRDRSQVSRTLASLEALGLVARGEDRAYRLGWDWYAAAQELTERRLRVDGIDVLERLSAATDEACFLGVLAGDRTVTIVESLPSSSTMIGSWIGRAYPAYCSDAGQAVLWDAAADEVRGVLATTKFESSGPNAPTSIGDFLERLEAARRRGFAIVDEEAEPGLYSVSAPVRDFRREVVAAVQVVGSAFSLGHDDSLIVHVGTEGGRVAAYPEEFPTHGHLRLSVGIEDAGDLVADLEAALDATFGALTERAMVGATV